MKGAEIVKQIGYLLEGRATVQQWPLLDLYEAMNFALVKAAEALRCTITIRTFQGAPVAPGYRLIFPFSAPLEVIEATILAKDGSMTRRLTRSTIDTESQLDPGWRTRVGMPTAFMVENANTILLNRVVADASNYRVQVITVDIPEALALPADTVDPRIPEAAQNAIHLCAAAFLLSQAGDYQDLEKAGALMAEFYKQIGVTNG